jgi:VWFA-related protein
MARLSILLFGICLFALPADSLFAQTAPVEGSSAQLTLNVRTTVEDVVVMDKNGKAVPDLRQQDFQVLENGRSQVITFFEPNFAIPEAAAAPSALPANTFTNVSAAPPNNVTNVLLLDALNTWPEDRMYAQVQMVKYLASLPPDLRIGVFTLDSEKFHMIWGFNQDSSALRAAIAKFTAKHSRSSSHSTSAQAQAEQQELMEAVGAVRQTAKDQRDDRLGESADALQHFLKKGAGILDSHDQILTTMNALQALAHYLAGIPGRKNLFWLVGDFPLCNGCGETRDLLAKAGVSVYPIDAHGVDSDMGLGPQAFMHQVSTRLIDTETWAEETGGKAYHENDIHQEIADAVDHGSRYYTLAYVPSDHKEVGRERKVEVKVLSGDYKVFYRKSYFEQTPKESTKASAAPPRSPLLALMGRGMPNISEIPYRLKVVPTALQPKTGAPRAGGNAQLSGKLTRYRVVFQLQASGLSLVKGADGARRKALELALVVYSHDGKPLHWESRNIELVIKPDQWDRAASEGVSFHQEIDAPAGDVYLRTGVYDSSSNKMGTLEIPLSAVPLAQNPVCSLQPNEKAACYCAGPYVVCRRDYAR